MVRLTFLGGVGEIGGNKILLETDGARVCLDFGKPFKIDDRYFTTYLRPRGLADYLRLGLVDPVPGLYSKSALEDSGVPYMDKTAIDAVIISHVHYDHVAHLRYLAPKIKVFIGEATLRMLHAWETTSPQNKFGAHPYETFKTGSKFKVGDVEFEPIHVDHSTPAAYGILVHTPEGTVAYTGDLRRHGPKAEFTQDFLDKARESHPIALICEGTRVAPVETRKDFSEQGVFDHVDKLLQQNPGKLLATTFYERDVDRIITYAALAAKHGRKFAISAKVAYLLDSFKGDPRITVPDPHLDPGIAIYIRRKKAHLKEKGAAKLPPAKPAPAEEEGTEKDEEEAGPKKRVFKWENELLDKKGVFVSSDDIHAHQGDYILHLDFNSFTDFLDVRPDPGSLFVNSMSEPFTEDDINDDVKNNWLDFLHMDRHQAHASGHAPMREIFAIANEIAPQVILPVHTEHPEMFAGNVVAKVIVPGRGKTIPI